MGRKRGGKCVCGPYNDPCSFCRERASRHRSPDVKAVHNGEEGYTDNYFGGIGVADGPGHGHIRVNEQGNESIIRGAYEPGVPFARHDATELDSRE